MLQFAGGGGRVSGHLEAFFFLPGDTAETTLYFDDVRFESEISLGVRHWNLY